MSTEAVTWAMDDAPMLLTPKGKRDTTARHVLQVLAEHARPDGTNAHPSVARVQHRTGYDERTVQNALRRLEVGELIRARGEVDGRTRYSLAMHLRRPESEWLELLAEKESKKAAAAERKRRSRARVTSPEDVTVTSSNGVTEGGVTSSNDGRHVLKRRDVTSFNDGRHVVNAPLTTNNHQDQPPTTKDSSTPAALDPHLEAFGAFWLTYPKKRAREEAKKAWTAAIERGADPKRIVDAAQAYARERADEDPRFTKHPATWLNKGCYDDEPDPAPSGRPQLRAVSGGTSPYQNPTDNSVYYEEF